MFLKTVNIKAKHLIVHIKANGRFSDKFIKKNHPHPVYASFITLLLYKKSHHPKHSANYLGGHKDDI